METVILEPTGIASYDTALIQDAEDNPCVGEAVLGVGTWAIGKRALRAGCRISNRPTPLVIRGAHEHGTILKLVDMDGGIGGDTHMLAFDYCDNLSILNLTLDGNRAGFAGFNQQAHGLYINGCRYLTIENVHTRNMIMDGAYFIGEAEEGGPLVQDVVIRHTSHENNDRSGLAFQRGAKNVLIDGLVATGLSDAAIDTEATGRPAENFTIRNVKITTKTTAFALSVGGYQGIPCRGFLLENIEVAGGHAGIYHADDITLRNVNILSREAAPPLTIRGRVSHLDIFGGSFTSRQTEAEDGVISLGGFNGGMPDGIRLYEVAINAVNGRGGVTAEDVYLLELYDCLITGTGAGNGVSLRNVSRTDGLEGLRLFGGAVSSFADGISLRPYADRRINALISQGVMGSNLNRGIYVEGSAYLGSHVVNNQWQAVTHGEVYE